MRFWERSGVAFLPARWPPVGAARHSARARKGRGTVPRPFPLAVAADYARCLSRLAGFTAGFTTAIVPVTASASVCVVLRWARTSSNDVP